MVLELQNYRDTYPIRTDRNMKISPTLQSHNVNHGSQYLFFVLVLCCLVEQKLNLLRDHIFMLYNVE